MDETRKWAVTLAVAVCIYAYCVAVAWAVATAFQIVGWC